MGEGKVNARVYASEDNIELLNLFRLAKAEGISIAVIVKTAVIAYLTRSDFVLAEVSSKRQSGYEYKLYRTCIRISPSDTPIYEYREKLTPEFIRNCLYYVIRINNNEETIKNKQEIVMFHLHLQMERESLGDMGKKHKAVPDNIDDIKQVHAAVVRQDEKKKAGPGRKSSLEKLMSSTAEW